jgi:hypothetical protein
MSDLEKILGLLGQSGGDLLQAVKQVQTRLGRIQELRDRGGILGSIFWWFYLFPQYIYRVSLGIATFVGICAVLGGVLKVLNSEWLPQVQSFFENSWLIIVAVGILLLLIALIDGVSLFIVLLLGWIPRSSWPSLLESPDWFNLEQFSNLREKPRPLALGQSGIDAVADLAVLRLVSGQYKSDNFAEKPPGLTDAERANAALFGCLLEQEHYIRKWGRRSWRPFYEALAGARVNQSSLFAPDLVISTRRDAQDFYSMIRQAVNPRLVDAGQTLLEDTPAVSEDVMVAADTLAARYKGSAANLPSMDGQGFDLRLAFDRLSDFKHLSGPGMGPQFLKLAVRWDVWPSIETGNFVYPFSTSLAVLFLDQEALVTLGDVSEFSFSSEPEQAIVRETMRRIVKTVEHRLTFVDRSDYHAFYSSIAHSPEHPVEWELAQLVDFVLWSEATEIGKKNGFANWRIGSNKFITRKQPT